MDIELLNKALENNENETIFDYLSNHSITNIKNKVYYKLLKLNGQLNGKLDENDILKLNKQLENYIYIDTIDKLKIGNYLRWISYKNNECFLLNKGGFLENININDKNDNINIMIKTITNKYFTLNFNTNFIFKKLTKQESIIFEAIKFLH